MIKEEDNKYLNKVVIGEEVKVVLYKFDPEKSPEPDGFTLHFYRKPLPTIQEKKLKGSKSS
jgi:hypothetical protein